MQCVGLKTFDGFIIISAVVCIGPDGSSVYSNRIRISSRLDRQIERPAPLIQHGTLTLLNVFQILLNHNRQDS